MRATLNNERTTMSFNGNHLSFSSNGLKISVPINSDTLLKALSNRSRLQVMVDVEINKK